MMTSRSRRRRSGGRRLSTSPPAPPRARPPAAGAAAMPRGRRSAAVRHPASADPTPSMRADHRAAVRAHPRRSARERTGAGMRATVHSSPTSAVGSSSGHARLNVPASSSFCMSARRNSVAGTSSSRLSVEDRQERLPHLIAGFVVRRPGSADIERLCPVLGAEPDVDPRRLDDQVGRRRVARRDRRPSRSPRPVGRTPSAEPPPGRSRRRPTAPSATRSRRVQICTLSSPRLGRMSST